MGFKKNALRIALAVAVALSAIGFVGCGEEQSADEAMIRDALASELELIKTLDDSFVDEMTAGLEGGALEGCGITAEEFLTTYLSGFDYEIESVSVNEDGQSAVATVTLTCRNLLSVGGALAAGVQAVLESEDAAAMSEAEVDGLLGQAVTDAISSVELTKTEPITVEYSKVNNVWTPTSASEQAIASALLG